MSAHGPRNCGWSRRAVLFSLAVSSLQTKPPKRRLFPAERFRFSDAATEFLVERLTDPAHSSSLPAFYCRAIARRGGFLLFWSDRAGSPQAFRLDERTGGIEQLTDAEALDGSSLNLFPDDRSFCYFDGPSLCRLSFSNFRTKTVYRVPDGWQRGRGFSLARDGDHGALIEVRNGSFRLRFVHMGGGAETVVESPEPLSHPIIRPRGEDILFRRGADRLWLAGNKRRHIRPLTLAEGGIGPALWSPDGRTVLYLHIPRERGKLTAIREHNPEEGADRLVGVTSQFAHFGPNADASVFVGASSNRASPHVLLLLRATQREMTLCEHLASDPSQVAPIFSPDSRRIYFQSDREGRPAIYRMHVDRLVEPTET